MLRKRWRRHVYRDFSVKSALDTSSQRNKACHELSVHPGDPPCLIIPILYHNIT